MAIKKIKLEDIVKSKGRTKKEDVEKITDAEIAEAVLSDKDSVIPTEDELREFDAPKERGPKNEKEGKA